MAENIFLPSGIGKNQRSESLIDYPCLFPIKVMGMNVNGFVHALTTIALKYDPQFDASSIELKQSAQSKYLGVTLYINAVSRVQLDSVYQEFTAHPLVKVVL